jgi:retrograde regulation protein 2
MADLMYLHQAVPKEGRATAGLYAPVTGILASVHGISHTDRALLAIFLYTRWDAEVAPPHDDFADRLRRILSPQEGWWAGYLGAVAGMVGNIYPSGHIPSTRVKLSARWADGLGKRGVEMGVRLTVFVKEGDLITGKEAGIRDWIEEVEKVGKRKRREALARVESVGSADSAGTGASGTGSLGSWMGKGSGGGGIAVGVRVEVNVERVEDLGKV